MDAFSVKGCLETGLYSTCSGKNQPNKLSKLQVAARLQVANTPVKQILIWQ